MQGKYSVKARVIAGVNVCGFHNLGSLGLIGLLESSLIQISFIRDVAHITLEQLQSHLPQSLSMLFNLK